MTTVRVSVQDWEIPNSLKALGEKLDQLILSVQETKSLFDEVSERQKSLIVICENAIKTPT